jgi:hypothetical protein
MEADCEHARANRHERGTSNKAPAGNASQDAPIHWISHELI